MVDAKSDDPHDTLYFTVSTENLDAALDILGDLLPRLLHPVAWEALMAERERRSAKAPPRPVIMTRWVYDKLPPSIKPLLGAPVVI